MKRNVLIIAVLLILVSVTTLTGCKRVLIESENGTLGTREYDYTDFNVVEIGYAFDFEVIPADSYSITIDASESVLKRVKVEKKGNKLEIGLDNWFIHFSRSPRVTITLPDLRGLHLTGASEGQALGFKSSHDFDLTLSGSSFLEMDIETSDIKAELSGASEVKGRLIAENADFELSGSSEMGLEGSAETIRLDFSGASEAIMPDFTVEDADVELSGASEADLTINGTLDIDLSGASTLWYSGEPTLGAFSVSGSSKLAHRNIE